jgi:hypothetical protein
MHQMTFSTSTTLAVLCQWQSVTYTNDFGNAHDPRRDQVFRLHADQRWGGGEELRPHLAADGRLHAEHVMSDELDDGSFTLILLRGHFAAGLAPADEGGPGIPLFQWYGALDPIQCRRVAHGSPWGRTSGGPLRDPRLTKTRAFVAC